MEAPFGGPLLEGPLFVHSSANKGPLCGGPFMGSTYRGPICGGWKRLNAGRFFEEGPLAEGPVWMFFFYKELLRLAGPHFAKGSLLGDFCRGLFVERHLAKGGSSSVQKRLSQSICRLPILDIRSRTWYKP